MDGMVEDQREATDFSVVDVDLQVSERVKDPHGYFVKIRAYMQFSQGVLVGINHLELTIWMVVLFTGGPRIESQGIEPR
jgi:hypothetical protein